MTVVLATQNLRADGDISTVGNTDKMNVIDGDVYGTLDAILKELRIMNIHLSLITDNIITKQEIE